MKLSMMTAALAAMSVAAHAAKNPDVTGQITDASGQPMSFVNVVLLSLPDSTFVQGATSDDNGKFNIVTPEGKGLLKISSIGYETLYLNMSDFKGQIQMREDSQLLSEITVKGQMPKTKLTGNSMVTSIQGSVLEKSGTAKEMLAKVPGMSQKGDDLEVLGKGIPVFYINGRKVNDKDELKRLRSEEIKDVEVITNPGAQYDATVSAVVRIKTIKRQGTGFGFDANLTHQQDLRYGYADPSATVNLRYRHKSVDFFGMINAWKWDNVNTSYPNQQSYFNDNGQLRIIDQKSWLRNDWCGAGMDYNLGFNWQMADNHSIGMRLERHDKFVVPMDMWQETDINSYLPQLPGHAQNTEHTSAYEVERDHTPYNWEGNAYYNGTAGKLGIDLNLDFLTTKTREETEIEETTTPGGTDDNLDIHPHPVVQQMESSNRTTSTLYAGKLVLSYPVWKGQLQAGTEMTFVTRKNTYVFDVLNQNRSTSTIPSTDSKVQENNVAAFVEYACQIPSFGNVSAGVRYEHVGFDYTDRLNSKNDLSRYTDDLFPSFSWSNQWGEWQTALSYSIKTHRPSYWQLSETMTYINPYSLQQGDPKLRNEKIQEVGVNVRYKWLNLFAAYERRDNTLTQWSYIYNDEGVILIKNINMDVPIRNFAMFLSASPTWGCWSPNWTAGVQKFFVTQTLADPREASGTREVRYTQPVGFFDLNNAFRFKHSWQLECNANLMTPGDVMNYRMRSWYFNLGLVVQKCWLKNDALCLRASVADVFQRAHQKIDMDCGYYELQQNSLSTRHRLNVSLRYTFNAAQSKYKGTGAGREAVERMSN